jgi:hypothetical protein
MSAFEDERIATLASLAAARENLSARVSALTDADLARARRGQWSIADVLDHLARSEAAYVRVAGFLRGTPVAAPIDVPAMSSVSVAISELNRQRAELLAVIDGVEEDTFYELRDIGHERYSMISLLENVELHDHEHAAQIADILAKTAM